MFLELVLLLAAAVPARPFAEERALLDRRLEALQRVLPDGPRPTADAALVSELARSAALTDIDVQARAPLETGGTRGHVLVDVKARGRYTEIERFFRQVALSPRLADVDSLTLTATTGEQVALTAVVRLPYRPLNAPLPPAPEDIPRPVGMTRPQLGAYLHDQALSLAKSETIALLRRSRRNPRLFLSELAAVTRDRPVFLSQATLGEAEFVIRGMTTGESSVRDLEARLEQGFFRIVEMLVVHHGACHRFEVRGQSPVVGPMAEIPLPTEDPFRVDDAACRVDRDSGSLNVLRAPRFKKGDPRGPLTLRLRSVDLADAFLALHHASGQTFLVDGEVRGRVSLDLDRVAFAQAVAALAQAGVTISAGPLHHVTRGSSTVAARDVAGPVEGDTASPVTLSVKRAAVSDLLAVFAEADPALLTWGPQPALGLGRLSVFAKNVPAAVLRAGVLDAVSLRERRQDDRRLVGVAEGTTPALLALTSRTSARRLVLPREDLAVHEFELSGVAGSESGWSAFVYSPGGSLHVFRAGDRIRDASVVEIDAGNATLSTDEGLLRVPLN